MREGCHQKEPEFPNYPIPGTPEAVNPEPELQRFNSDLGSAMRHIHIRVLLRDFTLCCGATEGFIGLSLLFKTCRRE